MTFSRLWTTFCSRSLALLVSVSLFSFALAADEIAVRYLRFEEVQETIQLNADSGLPGTEIRESTAWNAWIRARDSEVRERIDRGVEDSISNFILYGTSFTALPRVENMESAASESGDLTSATNARIHALTSALLASTQNERVRFVREFLRRKGIAKNSIEPYFAENLRRAIAEQAAYQKTLKDAQDTGDPTAVFFARGTLFETRGLSVDTSLLPNFAIEETLRAMLAKHVLSPGSMHRIAIIGPGLDFTDKRDGYDFYPLQTLQPFAVLEGVGRLGLGKAEDVRVVCLDLNSAVISHIATLAAHARTGRPYTLQLPRDARADWTPDAISYWKNFGEILGSPAKALPVPGALSSVVARAVAIRPTYAAHVQVYNSNIVTQTLDFPPGRGFDLVVATNVLVYYDRFQQALAMTNIARMMNPGGVFLANNVLPAQHTADLEYLGRRSLTYTPNGAYGDDVVVYRRR